MINDIQSSGAAGGVRRVLAVVSGRFEQAREIKARFAEAGDEVETLWFASSRDLLARTGRATPPPFEAVILFASDGDQSESAADLRAALEDTPLFQVSDT